MRSETHIYCGACYGHQVGSLRFCDRCGAPTDPSRARQITFGPNAVRLGRVPELVLGMFAGHLLTDHIGAGGMGDVYAALQPRSGQRFALKVVGAERRMRASALRMFEEEAQLQSRLVHPNVVRVFGLLQDPQSGQLAILMELVDGTSLDQVISGRATPLPVADVTWFVRGMGRGLAVVHRHGFIHADVKPSNYLLGRTEARTQSVKLTDFGIARNLRRELLAANPSGRKTVRRATGTPGYMSPEQIQGADLAHTSDLYSLGCVVYELLAGRPVFPVREIDLLERLHQFEEPVSLAELRPDAPDWLCSVVHQLLAKSPHERGFTDASGLMRGLDALAGWTG